jgi:hypothetical protein
MRRLTLLIGALLLMLASPMPALACSPPFNPTIEALGPSQLVPVGTIGERVNGGRLFHIERAFNGPATTPIIAPFMEDGGLLSADLGTLQATPDSPDGLRYLNEAETLFGPGIVPGEAEPGQDDMSNLIVAALAIGALVAVTLLVVVRRARAG